MMKVSQISALAEQGESHTLEFKKSTSQLKPAFETVCAFLNGKGGVVLIGVQDNGHIVGQCVADNTRQDIAREIQKIEPPAQIEISYLPIKDSKSVIVLKCPLAIKHHIPMMVVLMNVIKQPLCVCCSNDMISWCHIDSS